MAGHRKLGRPTDQRMALLRGQVTELINNGRIETTLTRGKEVQSIAEKLQQNLEQNFGVARYGAAGEEFDPNIHEALMHNAKEGVETDVIDVVMQPGYRVGEKVVRPARGGVAGPA